MKKNIKKYFIRIICTVQLLLVCAMSFGCDEISNNDIQNTAEIVDTDKFDAVIILPGFMGSRLYAEETITIDGFVIEKNEKIWDPIPNTLSDLTKTTAKISALAYSVSGNSIKSHTPIVNIGGDNDKSILFGTNDTYGSLYSTLYDAFYSETCDVIFYEYDWRDDPYNIACELDVFIERNGYESVVFVGHSMGGIVTAQYIALGETQRSKVHMNISVCTPYLGTANATMACAGGSYGDSVLGDYVGSLEIDNLACELLSVYSLIPPSYNMAPYLECDNGSGEVSLCENYSGTVKMLSDYNSDVWNSKILEEVTLNQNRLFTENGLSTEFVNSYYIVGTGEKTLSKFKISIDEEKSSIESVIASEMSDGDGTVTVYSATAANTLESSRIFYKLDKAGMSSGHVQLIDGNDMATIEFIVKLIDGEVSGIDDETLESLYGISKTISAG